MEIKPNSIIHGDCIEVLSSLNEPVANSPESSCLPDGGRQVQADLIFADPPFNIGYKYDVYNDRKKYDEYYNWTKQWMGICVEKALKPTGSFWIAIGDEYAAEVRIIARQLGLTLRNWVIWYYTFGQATRRKFARSHTHLLYFVKDPKHFTFNDMAIRIPSARQTIYADKRANPAGKVPDDVWTFPRICGTFNERVGWHPCQMPEKLLERIILACTNEGDLVLDPFAGSGTTCVVAAKLNRRYIGIEISEKYVAEATRRIASSLQPHPSAKRDNRQPACQKADAGQTK